MTVVVGDKIFLLLLLVVLVVVVVALCSTVAPSRWKKVQMILMMMNIYGRLSISSPKMLNLNIGLNIFFF